MPSDRGAHSAEGSSRKRIKISRDASRPAGMSQAPESTSITSPVKRETSIKVENDLHADGTPCHHEQSLRNMTDNLDTMRQLITCKICQRFLYEPYALTCGHTFCYSCLSQWLGQNRKKTCPDCRTVIREQPSPSYLVREMVLVFTSKSELLPDGETSEEHVQCAKEEAEIVANDKANTDTRTGGLFKGSFNERGGLLPLVAIRDPSDNVDRCPQCLHEVEDGRCNSCNVRVRGEDDELDWSDEDSDESEELDHDIDVDDDDLNLELGYPSDLDGDEMDGFDYYDYGVPPEFHAAFQAGLVSDPSDDESEDDHDPEMDGFIDDGPHQGHGRSSDVDEDSDGTELANARSQQRRRGAPRPVVISDDEEDEDDEPRPFAPPRRRVVALRLPSSSRASEEPSSAGAGPSVVSDDEDDDEGPITASQRSRRERRHGRSISIEDSDDESHVTNQSAYGGFSPPQYDLTGDSDEEDHEHEHDYHDDGLGYDDHFDDRSATSGPTEQSLNDYDEDDEEDRESDGSDDGWGPNSQSAVTQEHRLTRAADTQANPRITPHGSSTHRLHTLGSHRNRHADPPSDSPPSYSSLYPTREAHQQHGRLTNGTYRPSNPAFQPVHPRPTHPFNLDSTLAHIRNETRRVQQRYNDRRNDSNVSSQSSAGGVSVRSEASGSSGSSRTVRARDSDGGSRRRRYAEIVSDGEDDVY